MGFLDIYFGIFIPTLFFIIFILLLKGLGKYPDPLPRSENPRKELIEIIMFALIVIIYLTLKIFVLDLIPDFFYITLGLSTIIYLFVPLIYVHIKDHWTFKDLGINFKIKSRWILIASLIFYTYYGWHNTLGVQITSYQLLFLFYSNAFLEEFLFRGVIQSKLERAFGQKKSLIYQAVVFMMMHFPVNTFQFSLNGDLLRFFSFFGFQLLNGIVFGLIYLKTRNLWVTVICHYLGNWLGAIITLFLG